MSCRRSGYGSNALRLADLVLPVRMHTRENRPLTVAPENFYGERVGAGGGERIKRIRAREIEPADRDFLLLHGKLPRQNLNLRAHGLGIQRRSQESNRHSPRGRVVPKHAGRAVETVRDDIQITVAVEICCGHAVRYRGFRCKAPFLSDFSEGDVAVVVESDVLQRELWKQLEFVVPFRASDRCLYSLPGVGVHHVPEMSRADQ